MTYDSIKSAIYFTIDKEIKDEQMIKRNVFIRKRIIRGAKTSNRIWRNRGHALSKKPNSKNMQLMVVKPGSLLNLKYGKIAKKTIFVFIRSIIMGIALTIAAIFR